MPGTKRFGELKKVHRHRHPEGPHRPAAADGGQRTAHPHRLRGGSPPACEDTLTDLGRSLRPVLDAMEAWGKSLPRKCPLMRAFSLSMGRCFQTNDADEQQGREKHPGRGGWLFEDHNSQHHRTQGANSCPDGNAVPMGKVFTAWAKSQTLAAIATTVRTEYPTLVKPSDSFIAVTQTISRHPAANRQIHAITPSSLSHQ